MAIEDPILIGVVVGLVVWLGQEIVKFIIYQSSKCVQTRKIKKTLRDLYGSLEPRKSRDDHLYNTLFGFESQLEGLVQYANAVDHGKKRDIHGVIKQIASILNFVWRNRTPAYWAEHDRSYLNINSNELKLIKREIESIDWLEISDRKAG